MIDSDGGNEKALTDPKHDNFISIISPDGKSIIYTSNRNGYLELYYKLIAGTNENELVNL